MYDNNPLFGQYNKQFIAMRYWLLGQKYYLALHALEFASTLHTGIRKDGLSPEFSHQLYIAHYFRSIAANLEHPEETLATVFLHGVCEDYGVSPADIERRFGSPVAEAVRLLTKITDGRKKSDVDYYRDLSANKIASVVKGADRIHNIQTMLGVFTLAKQEQYVQETEDFILPALKMARRHFPSQEAVYENIKHMLQSQIELLSALHAARRSEGKEAVRI